MSEQTFSTRAVAALLGVGLLSFAGFALLLAFSGGPSASDGQAHAASRSAVGFAGVVQLLRDTGTPVRLSRSPAYETGDAEGDAPGLTVLTPAAESRGPKTMPEFATEAVLIVLPKWKVSPDGQHSGWVENEGLLPATEILSVLPADWPRPTLRRRAADAKPPMLATSTKNRPPMAEHVTQLQTIEGRGWTAIVRDQDGRMVLARHTRTGTLVLADPDLINDLALPDVAGAQEAVALLTQLAENGPIAFDVSLNGFGRSRNLLRLMFEPPLLGATLCAIAAAALIGLLSARRFGPPRVAGRAIEAGKRALADNTAGLIALAGREPRMAGPYAELTRALAARATGAPRRLTGDALDTYLDGSGKIRGLPDRIGALRVEAVRTRDRIGLMQVAARLYAWRMGLQHGRD